MGKVIKLKIVLDKTISKISYANIENKDLTTSWSFTGENWELEIPKLEIRTQDKENDVDIFIDVQAKVSNAKLKYAVFVDDKKAKSSNYETKPPTLDLNGNCSIKDSIKLNDKDKKDNNA